MSKKEEVDAAKLEEWIEKLARCPFISFMSVAHAIAL